MEYEVVGVCRQARWAGKGKRREGTADDHGKRALATGMSGEWYTGLGTGKLEPQTTNGLAHTGSERMPQDGLCPYASIRHCDGFTSHRRYAGHPLYPGVKNPDDTSSGTPSAPLA